MSKQTDLLNLTDAIDSSADATALTIDSSENVMVGTTTPTLYNVSSGTGLSYRNGIALDIARQNTGRSQPLINLNLTGADGDHLLFYKDGASIGNIGNISDDLIIYSTATNHSGLRFGQGYIFPVDNTGNTSDGVQDLGLSVGRYKDAYLSGGVYLGGTGSANYLDDYEEGEFGVSLTLGSGSATLTAGGNTLAYTKVGRIVTITGQLRVSSTNSPNGDFRFTLPFASASGTGECVTRGFAPANLSTNLQVNEFFFELSEGSSVLIVLDGSGTTVTSSSASSLQGNTTLGFNFSYRAT